MWRCNLSIEKVKGLVQEIPLPKASRLGIPEFPVIAKHEIGITIMADNPIKLASEPTFSTLVTGGFCVPQRGSAYTQAWKG